MSGGNNAFLMGLLTPGLALLIGRFVADGAHAYAWREFPLQLAGVRYDERAEKMCGCRRRVSETLKGLSGGICTIASGVVSHRIRERLRSHSNRPFCASIHFPKVYLSMAWTRHPVSRRRVVRCRQRAGRQRDSIIQFVGPGVCCRLSQCT